ncbi:MAG: hypothetical protein RDU20_00245 [Desulfomonilaceae bacterium]|nr:hypothetical protein [Desulfomonilaceae bacterium]
MLILRPGQDMESLGSFTRIPFAAQAGREVIRVREDPPYAGLGPASLILTPALYLAMTNLKKRSRTLLRRSEFNSPG